MKICAKCQGLFKTNIKINGKNHNLGSRKFCLNCSPFGLHNTKKIHVNNPIINGKESKRCPKCEKSYPKTDEFFYFSSLKKDSLGTYCRKCSNIEVKTRYQKIKQQCIDYKGGKCVICNYNKYIEVMQFHHLDPTKKESSLSQNHLRTFEKVKKELDKCILVCANCHAEIHAGKHSKYIIVKEQKRFLKVKQIYL